MLLYRHSKRAAVEVPRSGGVIVPGGKARGRCVLRTIVKSEPNISIIKEARLRRLWQHYLELSTVYPHREEP